jgi:N-acetylglucosamine kinase-like BadF-type ATPase
LESKAVLYFAGIDLGSTMTKVVIIDEDEAICARVETHTGAEHRRMANKVMEEALVQAGLPFSDVGEWLASFPRPGQPSTSEARMPRGSRSKMAG